MLSTPRNAYLLILGLGLDHEAAVKLTADRATFEYFLRCLED